MSLRLICGRAGTGKSRFCFEEIKEKILQQSASQEKQKIYIITPEQFSFTAEQKLLEQMKQIGKNAVLQCEVLTFQRMAYRVRAEVGGTTKVLLSSAGKSMLLLELLTKNRDKLNFLGKSKQNIELVDRQLTEFKKHGITPEILKKVIEELEEKDKYLQLKLKDMLFLYEEFEKAIRNQYIEDNDILSILANQLEETDTFKNTIIYLDEFAGFTGQEYEIIKKLLVQAEVTVTITAEDLDTTTYPDTDIFYYNKKTADKLLYLANMQEIPIEKTIFLQDSHRFQNEELKFLEKNMFPTPNQMQQREGKLAIYPHKVENVGIFLANDVFSEIEEVAKKISHFVREKGYHYKDIAVMTKDLQTYNSLCKVIFGKYEIPVFMDEKKDSSKNAILQYVISIFDIFANNWSYESVFTYLKSGFINWEQEEINDLENYAIKWGIKGKKWWMQEDWNFGEEENTKIERLNALRRQIVTPLMELKQSLIGTKNVEQMTKQLYLFLSKNEIDKQVVQKIEQYEKKANYALAKEYKLSWEVLIQVLDECILVFGQKKTNFEEYTELLKSGMNATNLGNIPEAQDQVIVGDIDRSRSHRVKILCMIGVNDGTFPGNYKKEGFFHDTDREILKEKKIELAKTMQEKLYEDNFNIYKAFSTAEEKLFISYSSQDIEGKNLRASTMLTKVKKLFPTLQEKSDIIHKESKILNTTSTFEELIDQLQKMKNGEKIDEVWNDVFFYYWNHVQEKPKLEQALKALSYKNEPDAIEKSNTDKLYGEILHTSVSKLEQYSSCPFSYFLKYGLKLAEPSTFQIRALDTGNLMHEVIERFFEEVEEAGKKVKELELEEIKYFVEKIICQKLQLSKNYIFTSTPKFQLLVIRLKKVITRAMRYIIDSLRYSNFEVLGTEIEFKENREYAPIEIVLENEKRVHITGKIDRMDIAKTPEGEYIRIIDYKSSVRDIDLDEVHAGLQLQLLTYMDVVCQKEELEPAGVLYYPLIDPMIKANKDKTVEEIEEEIKKNFKMKGLIVADIQVVKMMDKTLEKGSSKIVPVYIDAKGNISEKKSSTMEKEAFVKLQKETKQIIKQSAQEIFEGNIAISPYYAKTKNKKGQTPCTYCAYQPICQFKAGQNGNNYRYIQKSKEE